MHLPFRRSSALLLAFLATLLSTACPKAPGAARAEGEGPRVQVYPDATADAALDAAIRVADSAPPAQALEAYVGVRRAYPETTAGQEALYRAGILAFETGDFVRARKLLNELLFENPLFDKAPEARLKLGLSALELHAYRDAYQTLSTLAERSEGDVRARALAGAARAAAGAGMEGEALNAALKTLDEAPAERRAEALAKLTELVERKAKFLDIAQAQNGLGPSHPAWPVLTFKLARIYFHLRDWTLLKETLEALLREAPQSPYASQAKELLTRANRRAEVKPKTVGLVLPMSGRYKPLGEAVMRGVTLALKGSDIEVVVKDSQGDPNLTGKAVEELTFDDGAIAAIGPLLGDDSRRAALVAEELQIPLLTLTRSESITDIGPHVFRNMLTNSAQAEALADYGTRVLGYKNFAVLYPNISYGVELVNDFWDAVQSRGGQVRGAESYDHDQTTFTEEAKKLVGRYYLEDRSDYLEALREVQSGESDAFRKRKAMEKVRSRLEPVVDFEALLIPDDWKRVGLVAPALAVEDIITNACDPRDLEKIKKTTGKKELKTVTLLGTNQWSSPKNRDGVPELLARGGKFVTCSVYVDGFYVDSSRPATKRFVSAYRELYRDREPGLLEAIGYDSAGMLRQVVEKAAPRSRGELREKLAGLKDFDGATGKTSFDDKREAKKQLFLLSIDNKGIKEISAEQKVGGI